MIKIRARESFNMPYNNTIVKISPQQIWYTHESPSKITLEVQIWHEDITLNIPVTDYYKLFKRAK